MSLSQKIGNIGNAEYFHPCNGEEPYSEYDEVVEVKHLKEAVKELKKFMEDEHRKVNGITFEECGYDNCWGHEFIKKIDEIFGEELTK